LTAGDKRRESLSIKNIHFNTGVHALPVTFTTRIEEELAKLIDEAAKQEGMESRKRMANRQKPTRL
jgi:hypothetical protein